MIKIMNFFVFSLIVLTIYSCQENEDKTPRISSIDISEKILGEWVYDNPADSSWQSMKFTKSGKFYYSEDKKEWSEVLKRTDCNYALDGMNVSGYGAGGT